MQVAGIVRDSIVDGIGVRDVVFVQGCKHHCVGCHNPNTWNPKGGQTTTVCELLEALADSSNDITISGGEPLDQLTELYEFIRVSNEYHGKKVWLFTGYQYEEVPLRIWRRLAKFVDVVIDGKFVEELKDPALRFRGSSNQRVIDLPKSVEAGMVILWEE